MSTKTVKHGKSKKYVHHYVEFHGDSMDRQLHISESTVVCGKQSGVNMSINTMKKGEYQGYGMTMTRRETAIVIGYLIRSWVRSAALDIRRKNYKKIHASIYGDKHPRKKVGKDGKRSS